VDEQSHTQSVRQSYSRRRSEDAAIPRNTRRDISDDDEEYDDVWPSRMPTSARRYQGDVRTEVGRVQADVQPASQGDYRTSSNPERTGGTTIPPRRTATQSMPAIQQPTRRTVTQNVPAAQSARRTATQSMPAIQQPTRRTVTQNVPAAQSARRTATQGVPVVQPVRRRPIEDFDDDIPQRTSGLLRQPTGPRKAPRGSSGGLRFHWLVYVGLAIIGMVICWVLLTSFLSWWQLTQDDLHYGRPRTAQYDVVVGHNDSNANKSHFIAINLRRHVEVIECPAGDCSKARVMVGPVLIGPNEDLAPVTLTFKDVNSDGKIDIIVNVQDNHFVFINDNGTFRPTRSGDNIHL